MNKHPMFYMLLGIFFQSLALASCVYFYVSTGSAIQAALASMNVVLIVTELVFLNWMLRKE